MPSCAAFDANGFLVATQETVCTAVVLLTPSEFADVQANAAPFDYTQALSFWSFAFGTTLLFWLVARGTGVVLNMIRRR